MRQFKRSDRLGAQICKDISELWESELGEGIAGMVTFTRVKLSSDLRNANVYYSYLGDVEGRDMVAGYLERERKRIRSLVGRNLHIKHIPEFVFTFDPSVEESIRLEKLFDEIRSDSKDSSEK